MSDQPPDRPLGQQPPRTDEDQHADARRPACPVCGGKLIERRGKLICSRCHTICETCCEGGRG